MGYYTHYSLEIEPETPSLIANIQAVEKAEDHFADFAHAFDEEGHCQDSLKWYEWEADMRRISLRHPNHVFHLHGIGEESEDIWTATFKGGLMHFRKADCTIPPYDEAQLA